MSRFVLRLGAHEVPLAPGRWAIGRGVNCQIRLQEESVSREHAVLQVGHEGVSLEDRGSRNGVRVDGERLRGRRELKGGERIEVGTVEVCFFDLAPEEDPFPEPRTRPMTLVEEHAGLDRLSPREREVLQQLAQGITQREIADALGVSVKTIETYRARLSEKLDLESRADLIRFALRSGLLKPEN